MAWKEPERNTISLSKCEVNREILGHYTGTKMVKANDKQQVIWQFNDEEDKPFGIWGCGSLNSQMEGIKIGSFCKIMYLGKSEKKNNFGNFSTLCKVHVWDGAEGEPE